MSETQGPGSPPDSDHPAQEPALDIDIAETREIPLPRLAPATEGTGAAAARDPMVSAWPGAAPRPSVVPAKPLAPALPPVPSSQPPPPAPPNAEEAARWQEVIAGYEREAKAMGADKRAAPLWFEMGRVFEERLMQTRQAASAYQQAFKTDPTFVPVIHAARRLFQDINNWPMVHTLLDAELAVERRPRQRAALLTEKGRILESKLNKPDDAVAVFKAAFDADPSFIPATEALDRVMRQRNQAADLALVLRRALDALPPGVARAARALELARLQEGPGNDPEKAVAAYVEVLQADPGSAVALHALERLYARLNRHEELITVLTKLWEAAPNPEETASVPLSVARVARYALGDDARAQAVLEKARMRTPKDSAILRALAELYAAGGRHQEHVEVLLALASSAKDEKQRAALHFEAGNILEERLKDEAGAITQYRAVVGINARFLPALQALGRLYQRSGRFDELAQMYEAEMASLDDPSQRVPRLFKLAELRVTALGDEEGAGRCYREILQLQPGYLPALKALGGLLVEGGRFEELIALYEEELKDTHDRDQVIFLLDKIAQIYEERLGRVDQAIETYERVLKVASNYLPAIRALAGLFARAERWTDLVRVNATEAELTQDQKHVLALLHKNGEIYEDRIGDKDAAIQAYRKVLALSPNYLPTLKSLGRLYSMSGQWAELVGMYRQEVEIARNVDTRVSLLFKVGELYEERLKDPQKAIGAYREVLKEKPDHHPAVRALMHLHLQLGDFQGLVEAAQLEAQLFTDPLEQAHTLYRAGEVLGARLGRPQDASALYQRALQLHPTFDAALSALVELAAATGDLRAEHEALKRALEAIPRGPRWVLVAKNLAELLAERAGEPEGAARLYDQILEEAPEDLSALRGALGLAVRRRDWARAIALAEKLADQEPEAESAAALHLQVASWRQHHVEPAQDPVGSYLRALEYAPNDPVALRQVERAYRRHQAWDALYALYDRERPQLQDPGQQLDLCMRMADVATYYLKNDERAVEALEKALQVDRTYMPALRRLGPLYDKLGRHSEKLQLLAAEAETTKDPGRAFGTLLEVAQLQESKFGNVDAALDCYFRILDRDPRHAESLQRADALLAKNQRWDRLVDLLGRKAAFAQDPAEKVDLMMRAAQVMVEHLDQAAQAVGILQNLLRMAPSHAPALQMLGDLHDKAGRASEAAQAYTVLLQVMTDPVQAQAMALVHRRAAQLFRQLGDVARAAQHYGAALSARPQDMALAGELTELYLAQSAWPQAADMLAAMAERDADVPARVGHYLRLAKVMEEGFQDAKRAMDAYRRALELKPDHVGAMDRLVELGERLNDLPALQQAYQAMIATTARTDRPRLAALHMRLALLYLQRMNIPDKGLQELKLAVEFDPDNSDARVMLASLYARQPATFAVALEEYRRVLAARPARVDAYHDLARIYDVHRNRDRQFLACEILNYFRQCNEGEQFFYADNRNKVRQESDAVLSLPDRENLVVHPKERGPVREVLKTMAPELHKVFGVDPAAFGVGRADKVPAKNPDAVRRLCDNIAKALGGGAFDLYVSKTKTMELAAIAGDPPAIIVGSDIVKRHQTREQRFLIGQRVEGMLGGHYLFEGMTPPKLLELVQAACLAVDENFPAPATPEVQDLAKKIGKALARATRKALAEPVQEVEGILKGKFDPAAHLRAARLTRLRAGLALSNDVEVAVRLTARDTGVTLNPADLADMDRKLAKDELRELFAFLLSDEYAALRQRLRFAVDS
ncbi:MAG: tetratricopeptide repeat protein [Deltaproteobacteria bacterium]|nr:tetratricopeptide repeat protein [Deltaproteobacteria bacterium]